jgi:hypothetical protein
MAIDTSSTRITLSPDVTPKVFNSEQSGQLARIWIRYLKGLMQEDGFDLQHVVAAEVRCIDLELAGLPAGIDGLRQFREHLEGSLGNLRMHVLYLTLNPAQSTIEATIRCTGKTQTGSLLSWDVRSLARFADGRLTERWDRAEAPVPVVQLRGAA